MKRMKKLTAMLMAVMMMMTMLSATTAFAAGASVSYRMHSQNAGWSSWKQDGAMAGTQAQGLRGEDLQIKLSGVSGNVEYQAHCQNYGWRGWVKNGASCGTSGESLRMEAVRIKLTGEAAKSYDIYYRVHVSEIGTMGWVKNGETAGTEGQSRQIESIEIKLVARKGGSGGVRLNVPYYSQTDSRWKDTYIGSKTIGAIGCTTTCLAMAYSYRTGSEVTPGAMKNKLSYSNNDLKWASAEKLGFTISSCKRVKPNQEMMKLIYNKLKAGRPVIMGCTKSSSSTSNQHWVVITGYTGSGSSFSLSDFTINDPNSRSRTTLEQFISYRPYMYKILY